MLLRALPETIDPEDVAVIHPTPPTLSMERYLLPTEKRLQDSRTVCSGMGGHGVEALS